MTQALKHCEIMTIAGTRPEVIKLCEFVKHFKNRDHVYVYTGQHYSSNLSDIFFEELETTADIDLKCQTADISMIAERTSDLINETHPSLVVVYGDTNSTMAAAYAARRNNVPIVHIEAGLRSFDNRMAEERNRIKIDNMSNYLLCPTSLSAEFLKYEGITQNVSTTGNLIVDVCLKFAQTKRKLNVDLPDDFILLTMHRAENVDDPESVKILAKELESVNDTIIFPIHPRTRKMLLAHNISMASHVRLIEPLGYLDFLTLLNNCKLVLTDSGGVQEEAIILSKPCITIRQTTERWETILCGGNRLFPLSAKSQVSLADNIVQMKGTRIMGHPYGENVTERTVHQVNAALNSLSDRTNQGI